jgi:hypothetical protein
MRVSAVAQEAPAKGAVAKILITGSSSLISKLRGVRKTKVGRDLGQDDL